MEKVKLLPQQLEQVKSRFEELEKHIAEIQEDYKNQGRKVLSTTGNEFGGAGPDVMYFTDLSRSRMELKELNDLLNNYELVNTYDGEQIEIGTKFVVTLKKGKDLVTTKHMLIADGTLILDMLGSEYQPVSIRSAFGQAVRSKKTNEVITYCTEYDGLVMGVVDEIVPVNEKNNSENDFQLTK